MPPPLDLRADGNTTYKLAVVCRKCRIHADIQIDHSNSINPCPAPDHPLHHFQRVTPLDRTTSDRIRYVWNCSAADCHANLFILFRRPRLIDADLNHLTNPELLKRRYDALVQEDPHRDGLAVATPMDSLSRLRRYVSDSLNPQRTKRQFPSNNKRFQEAFGINGHDCYALLDGLGFRYEVVLCGTVPMAWAYVLTPSQENTWTLPNPPLVPDRLRASGDLPRELLEDVEVELLAIMSKLSAELGVPNPAAEESWSSANRDIERTLAAQGCMVSPQCQMCEREENADPCPHRPPSCFTAARICIER